jgi:hypothetical protein
MKPVMRTAVPAAALTFFMTGSTAYADVTASDVWADWTNYMAGFGYQVTGDESRSGDTLTVSDITMSMQVQDGEGSTASMQTNLGQFEFIENGDGTVSMVLPEVMPITMAFNDETDTTVTVKMEYRATGLEMTVSGDPEAMTYDYKADEMGFALVDIDAPDEDVDIEAMEMKIAEVQGSADVTTEAELRSTKSDMTGGPVTYTVDFTDQDSGEQMQVLGEYTDFSYTGSGTKPLGSGDPMDFAAMLDAGFDVNGRFEHGGGTTEFSAIEDAETVSSGTSETASGSIEFAMSDERFRYSGNASGTKIAVSGEEIPFPVEIAMENSSFGLSLPVSSSDEPQDFAFSMTFGDFTISDQIWSMFDPAGTLPRDPATVAVDLAGKAKLLVDMMDPDQMAEVDEGDKMFGELNALTINDVTIRAAGAELTGEGDFTFDNSDMQSFGGMPAPEGEIDLKLVGGNGLLDKLVEMGIVPEEQATGARMMMGLFAVPAEDEDTLTSKIVINEEGHVLANGQRLQ